MFALAAAISCAGTVLSQPPIKTTASNGWPFIISSVSSDIKFLKYMLVGLTKLSPREIVGKTSGSPPASIIPSLTALIS